MTNLATMSTKQIKALISEYEKYRSCNLRYDTIIFSLKAALEMKRQLEK